MIFFYILKVNLILKNLIMDKEYVDRLVEIKSRDNGWYRGYVVSIDTTEHLLVLRNGEF